MEFSFSIPGLEVSDLSFSQSDTAHLPLIGYSLKTLLLLDPRCLASHCGMRVHSVRRLPGVAVHGPCTQLRLTSPQCVLALQCNWAVWSFTSCETCSRTLGSSQHWPRYAGSLKQGACQNSQPGKLKSLAGGASLSPRQEAGLAGSRAPPNARAAVWPCQHARQGST